jgi:hypothetical protein
MSRLVDLFILAYLLVAVLWYLPGSWLWSVVLTPLAPLVSAVGFDQYWGMFAPDPPTSDRDLVVIIVRESGAAITWEPPRLHALSRWEAFLGFRYRSYEHDILYDEEVATGREALAEYLLRKYDFGLDPPRAVVFSYVDRPIAPPGQEKRDPTTRVVFFTHDLSKRMP